jgi:hypothetical protein
VFSSFLSISAPILQFHNNSFFKKPMIKIMKREAKPLEVEKNQLELFFSVVTDTGFASRYKHILSEGVYIIYPENWLSTQNPYFLHKWHLIHEALQFLG